MADGLWERGHLKGEVLGLIFLQNDDGDDDDDDDDNDDDDGDADFDADGDDGCLEFFGQQTRPLYITPLLLSRRT